MILQKSMITPSIRVSPGTQASNLLMVGREAAPRRGAEVWRDSGPHLGAEVGRESSPRLGEGPHHAEGLLRPALLCILPVLAWLLLAALPLRPAFRFLLPFVTFSCCSPYLRSRSPCPLWRCCRLGAPRFEHARGWPSRRGADRAGKTGRAATCPIHWYCQLIVRCCRSL